ncbi:hypothetical protein E9232_003420 [Inquilinus ginsengisoli]|uniref:DUF3800 domain-containing protein n=1 Tax=Inquilinus ginsengisoli TaxID=363840 RepID=A0ABU1JSB7_9PROT|nr:DUF3800 domain-containing protein [Inquilinus ginsengisoli]MDR6290894.1 hypothetical protein [Inquilinus ginsengisoli]
MSNQLRLHAYIDDSASDTADRRLFLAGYVNFEHIWSEFSAAWAEELKRPPSIAYFKMAEAQNLSGQFRGWPSGDRDSKLLGLARLPAAFGCWSSHVSISRKDHAEILAPVSPASLKPPYFACWWALIDTMARYHSNLGGTLAPPVDFIFDEQGGAGADAALWFPWLKASQLDVAPWLGSTPIFRDDKTTAPLQAADTLAWHLRRRHERGPTEPLPAFGLLVGDGVHAYRDLDRGTLEGLAKGFRKILGVEFVQTKAEWHKTRDVVRAAVAAGLPPPNIDPLRLRMLYLRARMRRLWTRWRHPGVRKRSNRTKS